MRSFLTVLVVSSLVLAGCGDSRLNPRNWFGKKQAPRTVQTTEATAAEKNPLIPDSRGGLFSRRKQAPVYEGVPVDQVTEVAVERTAGGAVVRVGGLSLRQGAYDVRLTSDNKYTAVDGVLTLTLKAVQPTDTRQGPERTRRIQAARYLSRQELEKIRAIQSVGARNYRVVTP